LNRDNHKLNDGHTDLPLLRWTSTHAAFLLLFVAVTDIIAIGRHGWQLVLVVGVGNVVVVETETRRK
jgi:hypothetical protein